MSKSSIARIERRLVNKNGVPEPENGEMDPRNLLKSIDTIIGLALSGKPAQLLVNCGPGAELCRKVRIIAMLDTELAEGEAKVVEPIEGETV